jgi:hypothetical protein
MVNVTAAEALLTYGYHNDRPPAATLRHHYGADTERFPKDMAMYRYGSRMIWLSPASDAQDQRRDHPDEQ